MGASGAAIVEDKDLSDSYLFEEGVKDDHLKALRALTAMQFETKHSEAKSLCRYMNPLPCTCAPKTTKFFWETSQIKSESPHLLLAWCQLLPLH